MSFSVEDVLHLGYFNLANILNDIKITKELTHVNSFVILKPCRRRLRFSIC
jgi:hypothetical protein